MNNSVEEFIIVLSRYPLLFVFSYELFLKADTLALYESNNGNLLVSPRWKWTSAEQKGS